jgi:allantoin racemase
MKIKVICPVVRHDDPEKPFCEETWEKMFKDGRGRIAGKETDFEVEVQSYQKKGVCTLESIYDLEICSAFAIPVLAEAEKEGFDAVSLDCYGDQGLESAKEAMDIPVVGSMESAMAIACLLGNKFSILAIHPGAKRIVERQVLLYQMGHRCASVRDVGMRIEHVEADMEKIIDAWIEAAKKAVKEDDADVIITAGTGLSCSPRYQRLKKTLKEMGIPVICGGETAFKVSELLVSLGLTQSKKRYPKPPVKERFF